MKLKLLAYCFLLAALLPAQGAIEWNVTINTQQVTQSDPSIFKTLEKDLVTFLNQPIWTNDVFLEEERIQASMFLTIREVEDDQSRSEVVPDVFRATVAIQSARPIYGSDDLTPMINTQDEDVQFGYRQFDQIVYTEQGQSTPLANIMAFYCYLILGFDYDSFSPRGGEPYFAKALELTQRLTDRERQQQGWAEGKKKNRTALIREITDPRMLPMRRAYYSYHRTGLDLMSEDLLTGRNNVTLAIEDASRAAKNFLGSKYAQIFVDAKREEIVEIYKGATATEQTAVVSTMSRLDPSQANTYRAIRTPNRARARGVSRSPASRSPRRPNGRQ